MPTKTSERLDWAREHFHGFENILMPSFTPDLGELDEDGIRHDIRQSIAHGFFSAFCVDLSLGPAERRRFYEVCADEAGGRIALGTPVLGFTPEDRLQQVNDAEAAGFTHILLHPPHTFRAENDDELYAFYREIIDATQLAVALWATDGAQFQNLHPSNVSLKVFDRLADLPTVVAVKLMTTLDLTTVYELCEQLHQRVLIGGVHLGIMPLLVKHYGMQWSGAWTIEALQSPDKQYVNEYLDHLVNGRTDAAMKAYWHIEPGYRALFRLMAPMLPKGVHPFTHLKYYQWCVGGNGGLLREPMDPNEKEFPLKPEERAAIREAFRGLGIEPTTDDDDVFVVGRAAHGRGVGAGDVPEKVLYAA